jgi:hypothetical protein
MVLASKPVIIAADERIERYKQLRAERNRLSARALGNYLSNPIAFAHDCFDWGEATNSGPTEYQDEIFTALNDHHKVAVRSLHGAGKTTTNALMILWFCITRDAAGIDWKCATTAGAWRQLEQYLWPEIRKWAKKIKWAKIGRSPFERHELLRLNLNLTHGSGFAVASDTPALIEGVHADSVMYVFDESKSISPDTFDAAEGAFSGGGEAFALATSTPGEPNGRFYELCTHKPGLEDWYSVHVGLDRAIASGRVSESWADNRKLQWGPNSALYANRVLGEFHSSDEDGVIPLSWIEAANERWIETTKLIEKGEFRLPALDALGVDVARSGDDKTVLALLHGDRVHELRFSFHEDTMATSGRAGGLLTLHPGARAIVDTDGLGAGVTDRLREQGFDVDAFHAGAAKEIKLLKDTSGELGFVNVRSAAWWRLRELLDPDNHPSVELPPDDVLTGDLTAPHWRVTSKSQIQVESKDFIRNRLGRSTDAADAVVQAFWKPRVRKKARMTFAGRASSPPPVRDVAVA